MAEPAPSLEQERDALALFRALIDFSEAEQQQRLDAQCQESPWVTQRVRAMLVKTPQTVGDRMLRLMDLPSAKSPAHFGPFRVVGLLGEGGMARVVRGVRATARSEQQVAIKYIPPDSTPIARERFIREREILARLQHPAIAPMLDFGSVETEQAASGDDLPSDALVRPNNSLGDAPGYLWYAMALIEGQNIDDYVRSTEASEAKRIELILVLCDALRCAHNFGVIHRDIKPSNVLVSGDGKLQLIDFGIAKAIDEITRITIHGRAPMTLSYAAPEQRADQSVSTATDQWQVAALAFELLSGERFDPTTPKPLKLAYLKASPDLNAVINQALRTEPEARYSSIAAFAEDLKAVSLGAPVRARVGERGYQLRKLLLRHRWAVAACVLSAVSLIAASVFSFFAAQRAEQQARYAVRASTLLQQVFLSDDYGQNVFQLTLGDMISNGVDIAIQDRELPAKQRVLFLNALSERAVELQKLEAAERALRESLRLAHAEPNIDPMLERETSVMLAATLITAPQRAENDAEILRLIEHALSFGAVTDATRADLAVSALRARAFRAAYRQEFDAAVAQVDKASEITQKWLAKDPLAQVLILRARAEILSAAGRKEQATQTFEQVIAYADRQAAMHPKLVNMVQWDRAQLCEALSASTPEKGIALCTENLRLLKLAHQDQSLLAFENRSGLGRCYNAVKQPAAALEQYQQAEQILIKLEGANSQSLRMASVRRRIGARLIDLGRAREALLPLQSALANALLGLPSEHPHTNEIRAELAQALLRSDKRAQAQSLMRQITNPELMNANSRARYQDVIREFQ